MTYGYGLLFASLASLCWGIAPVLHKRALREMGLGETNALRGLGMLMVLVIAFFFANAKTVEELLSLSISSYLILALVALMNNVVGDVFYFIAIRDIGVSLTTPITNSYPLIVALFSRFWFGEVLTFPVLSGTFFVVAGLALLNAQMAETRGDARSRYLRGVVSAIMAALCWGLGMILHKYLTLHGVSPTAVTFWRGIFFGCMAVAFLPLSACGKKETRHISAPAIIAAASVGIISLIIGGWFYVTSLLIIPMNVATPIASSSPMVSAMFACTFMGESLRPVQWLGVVCVVAGALAVSL